MGETDPSPPKTPPRGRRRYVWLAIAMLVVVLGLGTRWAAQPDRIARLALRSIGNSLGLEITASGSSQYRLSGTPTIVVRDLVAREPGATTPLLRARRVYLALPWSTLRARGDNLTVKRVEIESPRLDIAAFQHWQASRPPSGPLSLPTLTDGLRIDGGEIIGAGWSVDQILVDLATFAPAQPVRGKLAGRFRKPGLQVPFSLQVALTGVDSTAGIGAVGSATVHTDTWRMPMQLRLSGRLHQGDDGLGLDGFRSGARSRYIAGDTNLPFVFGIAGPLRYREGEFTIQPMGAVLRGEGVIPTLDARGRLHWQDVLDLQLAGRIADWPQAWPALPSPLDESDSPLPFAVDYLGPPDLSASTSLQLRRDRTRFDGRFRLPQVLDWMDTLATGSPVPPLDGRLTTPQLKIAGATMQDIEIDFENDPDAGQSDGNDDG